MATMATFAKTFDVDISTGRPAASNEAYYHGETIEFRAVRGRSVVTNVEYSCVWYTTNNSSSVASGEGGWWKTDGLVFHPSNDVGAASYRFFMEGRDEIGRDWHANGLLRLLDSPGFAPNALELPVKTIDFAAVQAANAPWIETEADPTVPGWAKSEAQPLPPDYETVSNRAMNAALAADTCTKAQLDARIRAILATNTYNLAANAGYYLVVRDLAVAFGATVTNDPYAIPPAPAPSPEPAPSIQTRRIAMFIIPVNSETNGIFCGFELKASTNNFSHAADEAARLQYYAQSEIADTGMEGTNIWDRIRIYTGTSHGTDDVRAYTRIPNTIEWPWPLTSVVALVDASCLVRHPSGDWLREDNEEIVWCYLRNRALSPPYERESGTAHGLWRPIAPVRWYKELPPWAR